jgi:NAD-dependent dihydropyrimidine dehydrogenase PreA subunit
MDNSSPILVVSRQRQETLENSNTASLLAEQFNTRVLDIPFLYDFPADHPVIERLRFLPVPAYFLVPIAQRSVKNLLAYLQIPYTDVFETREAVQIPDGGISGGELERLDEPLRPRWYPIIDASQCSACLECVNYCLFSVYAIDGDSQPFVEQPDACRDGCPACARVCPSQAIMFPLYEDRIIAGYERGTTDDLDNLIDLVDQI